MVIVAWPRPQNSAHWPSYVPVWSAWNQVELVWPGIASILGPSDGTHQSWATSAERTRSLTGVSTGTTRVEPLLGAFPDAPEFAPYTYEKANCCAFTSTIIAFDGAFLTVLTLSSVYAASAARTSTGATVQPTSSRVDPCTWGGSTSGSPGRTRKRNAE